METTYSPELMNAVLDVQAKFKRPMHEEDIENLESFASHYGVDLKSAAMNIMVQRICCENGLTPLTLGAQSPHPHTDLLAGFLGAGYDPNDIDFNGFSPLYVAAYVGNLNAVKMLLNSGANINLKIRGGRTALMIACSRGHLEIIELLIMRGADPNIRDDEGRTARDYGGKAEVLELDCQIDTTELRKQFKKMRKQMRGSK